MDATAGVVVAAIGINTLRQVRSRKQVAIATLPLLFGVHQLIETAVWLDLQGRLPAGLFPVADIATWVYLLIAGVVVPVAVPYAFARLGVSRWPRLDGLFLATGIAAALVGTFALGVRNVPREIVGHQITYHLGLPFAGITLAAYVLATCGPGLVAQSRQLQLFALGNLAVVTALAALNQGGVISLWCVWAAITSVVINRYIRGARASAGTSPVATDSSLRSSHS